MTSEHCVLQAAGRCIHDCPNCELRRRRLSLRDIDGNLLPVRTDVHGRSRIWAAHPLDATPQADALVAAGVTRLMADATLLSPEECTFAVERVVRALAAGGARGGGLLLVCRAQPPGIFSRALGNM
jgi:putative protease